MQTISVRRSYHFSGIIAAVVLTLLLIGTSTGRNALAWLYLTATDAVVNATHIHGFPLDRLDPTCPQYM
jgi:hypothetical protein